MKFSGLMLSKYFAPLFWTQFLGAFNDNIYKNALIILITFKSAQYTSLSPELLIPLSAGIFILPFFLFSALAGQLADKYEKSHLIRFIKILEICIMLLATAGFYLENIYFLITVLFFMGSQSSLFGPVKYSILPQHLNEEGLLKGNGIIEMGTFLAILLGTLVGGIVIMIEGKGTQYISMMVVGIAIAGWLSSRKIPEAVSVNEKLPLNFNIFSETFNIIRSSMQNRLIYGAILAISWFWFIGATILAILPAYTHQILSGNEQVVTLLLTLFSVGIGAGSILAGKSKNLTRSIKWIVVGAIGITLSSLALYFLSHLLVNAEAAISASNAIASHLHGWREMFNDPVRVQILVAVLLLGISGGFYIVPLYVILQECSEISTRSRTIAANNIVNALFMVISAIMTMLLLEDGVTLYSLYALLGVMNILVVVALYQLFSDTLKTINKCKDPSIKPPHSNSF